LKPMTRMWTRKRSARSDRSQTTIKLITLTMALKLRVRKEKAKKVMKKLGRNRKRRRKVMILLRRLTKSRKRLSSLEKNSVTTRLEFMLESSFNLTRTFQESWSLTILSFFALSSIKS